MFVNALVEDARQRELFQSDAKVIASPLFKSVCKLRLEVREITASAADAAYLGSWPTPVHITRMHTISPEGDSPTARFTIQSMCELARHEKVPVFQEFEIKKAHTTT